MTSPIEHCWVLIGEIDTSPRGWRVRRRRHTRGQATMVEVDWAWALGREETHGDVVGFWHTHVGGVSANPSPRDTLTMHAWCLALGKPLVCVITAGTHSTAYMYESSRTNARRVDLSRGSKPGEYWVR